ncbi:hypothetical protein [Leuconostoc gasicomitatum]|uniref:hypothetical protein n=1 Tax=Leuconostoc gasicomitatum TaxID=115778 RepID=UPI001CC5B2D1|nr:hypothetical protein [Leuconostoc gasicomitatum]MBZ5958156.1 hypothetical protein [Leuconostoc gasicomitatum]
MPERNVQIILSQMVGTAESGVTVVTNPTLSFGMTFVPSNMSFDVLLMLDSVSINKEQIKIKSWIESIESQEIVSNSNIEFEIKGDENDNSHIGSNISRLQFINVPFKGVGEYKVRVDVDSQEVEQVFRIYKMVQ